MKTNLTRVQRQNLYSIFLSAFRDHPTYNQLGSTTRALYQDQIKFHFLPLNVPDNQLPPYPVKVEEEKNDDGDVVRTWFIIKLTLKFPFVENGIDKIDLVKKISKEHLINVAA